MTGTAMADGQKTHIGGIKFSEELVQVNIDRRESSESSFTELLGHIADKNINIPFLCHKSSHSESQSSFCIDRRNHGQLLQILNFSAFTNSNYSIFESVGTITVFPHRNSLQLFGKIVAVCGQKDLPVYGLCSSISAITISTDFFRLDEFVEHLQSIVELPSNHAPFRQQVVIQLLPPEV